MMKSPPLEKNLVSAVTHQESPKVMSPLHCDSNKSEGGAAIITTTTNINNNNTSTLNKCAFSKTLTTTSSGDNSSGFRSIITTAPDHSISDTTNTKKGLNCNTSTPSTNITPTTTTNSTACTNDDDDGGSTTTNSEPVCISYSIVTSPPGSLDTLHPPDLTNGECEPSSFEEVMAPSPSPGSPILQPSLFSPPGEGGDDGSSSLVGSVGGDDGPFLSTLLPPPPADLGPNTNFTHTFLKSILTSIDSKDPVVANAWLETLLDVMDLLPKEVIREEILPVAVSKSQSPHVSARLAACKLIGKLSTKFEPLLLRQEVCGAVQCLSADVSCEVRAGLCGVLASVSAGLGLHTTKTHLLPDLVELCSDDEIAVRLAALHALADMLDLLDHGTRTETVVPLVRKVCERCLRVTDASLPLTAHLLGPLCHALHEDLTAEEKHWFLDFYCKLAVLGLPADARKAEAPMPDLVCEVRSGSYEAECRQQCAFNLPGMLVFASSVDTTSPYDLSSSDASLHISGKSGNSLDKGTGFFENGGEGGGSDVGKKAATKTSPDSSVKGGEEYRHPLLPTLSSLVADPSVPVRVTTAKAFHQVCLCLGGEAVLLREPLLQLLHSDSLEVLAALLPSLPHVLHLLHPYHASAQANSKVEIVVVLLRLEERVVAECGGVWRQHADTLHHMANLVSWMPAPLLVSHLIPRMVDRMHTAHALPCRTSAARTLLVYLQHLPNADQQAEVARSVVTEFCESDSCHERMLFLTLCSLSLELLPHHAFKQNFSKAMIAMHGDRVANIRLRVVSLLPMVKASLILPDDRPILQALETAVGSLLLTEADKDVCAAVSGVIGTLDSIEVRELVRQSPDGRGDSPPRLAREGVLRQERGPTKEGDGQQEGGRGGKDRRTSAGKAGGPHQEAGSSPSSSAARKHGRRNKVAGSNIAAPETNFSPKSCPSKTNTLTPAPARATTTTTTTTTSATTIDGSFPPIASTLVPSSHTSGTGAYTTSRTRSSHTNSDTGAYTTSRTSAHPNYYNDALHSGSNCSPSVINNGNNSVTSSTSDSNMDDNSHNTYSSNNDLCNSDTSSSYTKSNDTNHYNSCNYSSSSVPTTVSNYKKQNSISPPCPDASNYLDSSNNSTNVSSTYCTTNGIRGTDASDSYSSSSHHQSNGNSTNQFGYLSTTDTISSHHQSNYITTSCPGTNTSTNSASYTSSNAGHYHHTTTTATTSSSYSGSGHQSNSGGDGIDQTSYSASNSDGGEGGGLGPRGGVRGSGGRRSSGLPSYMGGSRRLSAVLPPPKLPPDRSTVMRHFRSQRNSDSFHEEDLRQLCDEVLLSPQDPTVKFSWDSVVGPDSPESRSLFPAAGYGHHYHQSGEEDGCGGLQYDSAADFRDHYTSSYSTMQQQGIQRQQQYLLNQQQQYVNRQQQQHFVYPNVSSSAPTAVTDSVIYKAQQKLEQATGFKLPKEFVKLGSQLVGSDSNESLSTSEDGAADSSLLKVASQYPSYSNKSPETLPPIPSTQTLLANLRKQDPTNFTEEAWQTCKLSKLKLCDKLASYREKANNISSKELFWLRSSRPRWRRKVASADTSPEEQNRHSRFTRGLSEDSAQRSRYGGAENDLYQGDGGVSSYGDSEDTTDVSQYSHHIHHLGAELEDGDCASPPSPHGMYTWPPQHARHRHLSSAEDSPTKLEKAAESPTPDSPAIDPPRRYLSGTNPDDGSRNSLQYKLESPRRLSRTFQFKDHSSFNSSIGGIGSHDPNAGYISQDYNPSGSSTRNRASNFHDGSSSSVSSSDYKMSEHQSKLPCSMGTFNLLKSRKDSTNDLLRSYNENCVLRSSGSSSLDFMTNYFKGSRPQHPLPPSYDSYGMRYPRRSAMDDFIHRGDKDHGTADIHRASDGPVSGRQLPQSTSHPDICFHNRTLSARDNRDGGDSPDLRDCLDLHDSNDFHKSSMRSLHDLHDPLSRSASYYHRSATQSPGSQLASSYQDRYSGHYDNTGISSTSAHNTSTSHHVTPPLRRDSSLGSSRYSFMEGKTSEDLYVVHGIPPTIAGRDRSSIQGLSRTLSFPSTLQTDIDNDFVERSPYASSSNRAYNTRYHDRLSGSQSTKDLFSSEPVYETISANNDKSDKYRYQSYSDGRTDAENIYDVARGFGFLDSGEFASRASSTAYPIGPLGASWLQQGMIQSSLNARHKGYGSLSSSSSPHPRLSSSPWPPGSPHNPSSSSLSALDPSADEFLVDAGIRIDEAALRSRLPTPMVGSAVTTSPSRSALTSDFSTSNSSPSSSSKALRPIGGSRLRPPTPSSRISGLPSDSGLMRDSLGTESSPRLRSSGRGPRPVSTTGDTSTASSSPLATRTKSQSHENLRLSSRSTSPHMLPDPGDSCHSNSRPLGSSIAQSNKVSAEGLGRTTSSRLPPRSSSNRPTSCSSSPGASRCTSPGLPSPPSSRSSSPGAAMSSYRITSSASGLPNGCDRNGGGASVGPSENRGHSSSISGPVPVSPSTPPSPAPIDRRQTHGITGGGGMGAAGNNALPAQRRGNSRLPLPTQRHR